MDYFTYVDLLQQQIELNSTRPKLFQYTTNFQYTKSIQDLTIEVLAENYIYTGNQFINYSVYNPKLNTIVLALEFASPPNIGYPTNPLYLQNVKYLYVPVANASLVMSKIPLYYELEVINDAPYIRTRRPLVQVVEDKDIFNWAFHYPIEIQTSIYTNPILPFFKFTGNVSVQLNKSLVYEYEDSAGYYGRPTQRYVSNLKPINLNYILGKPLDNEYEVDICNQDKIGSYPSVTNIHNLGIYTGFKTNNNYCPNREFYLYKRVNETQFLSTAEPNKYAKNFIQSLNVFPLPAEPTPTPSTQTVTVSQTTTTNEDIIIS